jgi:hypothetical protein
MNLSDCTNEELAEELMRRHDALGRCVTCHRWNAYLGRYDEDGFTVRCHGCLRAVVRCTCR